MPLFPNQAWWSNPDEDDDYTKGGDYGGWGGTPQPNPNPPQPPYPPWNVPNPVPGPGDGSNTTTSGGPGGGGGGGSGSGYQSGYGGPYNPGYQFDPVPGFNAPEFMPPGWEEAMNSPGYQFRFNESMRALRHSAAAKGTNLGANTLDALQRRGGNLASAEYANVWNRALRKHQEDYRGARDEYTPQLLEWQTLTAAEQRAKDLAWQRYWDAYTYAGDDEYRYWAKALEYAG